MKTKPTRYLNLLNDWSFKHVFGREACKDILIAFLNAILEGETIITDLEYKPTEVVGEGVNIRKVLFDLRCTTSNGEQILIEMQRTKQKHFRDRAVLYMSRLISQQLETGENWNKPLKKTFLISVLDFALNDSQKRTYLQDVRLVNINNLNIFYPNMVFKFLELSTFDNNKEYLKTETQKWMFLMKNMHLLEKRPNAFKGAIFEKVFKIAEMAKLIKEERMNYERESITKSDYQGNIDYVREETVNKIAIEMKHEGYATPEIAKITKLSIEEIQKL